MSATRRICAALALATLAGCELIAGTGDPRVAPPDANLPDAGPPGLFVTLTGNDPSLRVISEPPGIDCPGQCGPVAPAGTITLTATTTGGTFLGWRGGPPAAWLLAIARNVLVDHHRRGRRLVPLEETLLPSQAFPDTAVEVRDLLSRLPPNTRRLLTLAYLDGFTHAEIGSITGQSPAAVRSAVWRARDAARALAGEVSSDD